MLVYSGEDGTTVHMVHPHKEGLREDCECRPNLSKFPPSPCMLYWKNETGQTAKLNLLMAIKDRKKQVRDSCLLMFAVVYFNSFMLLTERLNKFVDIIIMMFTANEHLS